MTNKSIKLAAYYFCLSLALSPTWCRAELTGKDLLGDCEVKIHLEETKTKTPVDSTDAFRAGACTGYIKGFDDMEIIYASIIAGPSSNEKDVKKYSLYCLPVGASNSQMTKVVVNYIKSHPEELSDAASLAVGKALRDSFPCPKETPK